MNNFRYGIVDMIQPRAIPRGAAASSLNWLTKGDRIELRNGSAYLGTSSLNSGNGLATGIKKVTDSLGVEHLFGSYGKKVKYFDIATAEWIESGSDLLGPAVVDSGGYGIESIFFSEYTTNAGNQLFINSPHSAGFFKIMVANPGSSSDQFAANNFKGNIKIDTNRTFLWGRSTDSTGVYGSFIDNQIYTTVTAEATASLGGTLAFKAGDAARTCFGVQITITGTGEVYTDNYNGVLKGSLGGTGTINYTSGVYTLSNAGVGTANYQWEDSRNKGICDFSKSSPRLAGEGFIFRQDEGGGALKFIGVYNTIYYCMHLKNSWALNITSTDTDATNLPYRQNVGTPNELAACESGNGIYYIDNLNPSQVRVRLLTYNTGGAQQVIPVALSDNIDLNSYNFDQSAAIEWGDYVLFSCATTDSTRVINGLKVSVNNRTLLYNKLWKSWDVLDYTISCFDIYNGGLVGGDTLSNNFFSLFSGFDDVGSNINNHWIGNVDDFTVMPRGASRLRNFFEGLKQPKYLNLRGLIAPDQAYDVLIASDNGPFVKVGSIDGRGSYVDASSPVYIGSRMLGTSTIGGSGTGNPAYKYERLFRINVGKAETYQIQFQATGLGYVSVESSKWWDVRSKGKKVPRKYRG